MTALSFKQTFSRECSSEESPSSNCSSQTEARGLGDGFLGWLGGLGLRVRGFGGILEGLKGLGVLRIWSGSCRRILQFELHTSEAARSHGCEHGALHILVRDQPGEQLLL